MFWHIYYDCACLLIFSVPQRKKDRLTCSMFCFKSFMSPVIFFYAAAVVAAALHCKHGAYVLDTQIPMYIISRWVRCFICCVLKTWCINALRGGFISTLFFFCSPATRSQKFSTLYILLPFSKKKKKSCCSLVYSQHCAKHMNAHSQEPFVLSKWVNERNERRVCMWARKRAKQLNNISFFACWTFRTQSVCIDKNQMKISLSH